MKFPTKQGEPYHERATMQASNRLKQGRVRAAVYKEIASGVAFDAVALVILSVPDF
jgi:hypothetical protein